MELGNESSIRDRPVEELLSEIEAAWDKGDLRAYSSFYARNASYVNRAGMLVTGRTEIEKLHAAAFAGPLRDTRLFLKARRISFLTPLVAVVHADVELGQSGTDIRTVRALTTFVIARLDEGWRICAAHTSEAVAPPIG
jgi:uncharacterized protein (TIGR02246 family)